MTKEQEEAYRKWWLNRPRRNEMWATLNEEEARELIELGISFKQSQLDEIRGTIRKFMTEDEILQETDDENETVAQRRIGRLQAYNDILSLFPASNHEQQTEKEKQ